MSAKEMFEKLGYKCIGGNDYIAFKYYKRDETDIDITFYREKEISIVENEYINKEYNLTIHILTLEELQAINKQVEELGWNKWMMK